MVVNLSCDDSGYRRGQTQPVTTLLERIEWILSHRGIGQRELARRAKLADERHLGVILSRLRKKPNAEIERPTLVALATGGNVSLSWLATGTGTPDETESVPRRAPDDHVQPPAAEGSPLERALGEAFDPKRHTVTDLRAVQDALGSTYRWERPEADLLAAARTWLDSAAALRREGRAVDAVALLDRTPRTAARYRPQGPGSETWWRSCSAPSDPTGRCSATRRGPSAFGSISGWW